MLVLVAVAVARLGVALLVQREGHHLEVVKRLVDVQRLPREARAVLLLPLPLVLVLVLVLLAVVLLLEGA